MTRPSLGHLRIHPPAAAVIGAMLTVAAGLVPLAGVWEAVRFLAEPILTIASLMMMTLIAEDAGIFRFVAWRVASDRESHSQASRQARREAV